MFHKPLRNTPSNTIARQYAVKKSLPHIESNEELERMACIPNAFAFIMGVFFTGMIYSFVEGNNTSGIYCVAALFWLFIALIYLHIDISYHNSISASFHLKHRKKRYRLLAHCFVGLSFFFASLAINIQDVEASVATTTAFSLGIIAAFLSGLAYGFTSSSALYPKIHTTY